MIRARVLLRVEALAVEEPALGEGYASSVPWLSWNVQVPLDLGDTCSTACGVQSQSLSFLSFSCHVRLLFSLVD